MAIDEDLERKVAIKVPTHERCSRRRIQTLFFEAKTLAKLEHPNIVPIYDVDSTDQYPCILVSKYIEGPRLSDVIRRKQLPISQRIELVAQVADALHYAHQRQIIHQDVKPANILLDDNHQPFVADFGLALRTSAEKENQRRGGTPAYMSPEQSNLSDGAIDHRSDIFSLGVVLYELLTSQRPFLEPCWNNDRDGVAPEEPLRPSSIDSSIPTRIDRVCLKSVKRLPDDRYRTAKEFADELRGCLTGSGRPWFRPSILHILTIAVALTLLVGGPAAFSIGDLQRSAPPLPLTPNSRSPQSFVSDLVDRLEKVDPESVGTVVDMLASNPVESRHELSERFSPVSRDPAMLRIASAMGMLGVPPVDYLVSNAATAAADECPSILHALKPEMDAATQLIRERLDEQHLPVSERARFACLALYLGDTTPVRNTFTHSDDTLRTALIGELGAWQADYEFLTELAESEESSVLSTLCRGFFQLDLRAIGPDDRRLLTQFVDQCRQHVEPEVQKSATLTLRRWNLPVPNDVPIDLPTQGNSLGMTMIGLPEGRLQIPTRYLRAVKADDPNGTVDESGRLWIPPFQIADREVTLGDFRSFLRDRDYPSEDKPQGWRDPGYPDSYPAIGVNWIDAVMFCNWLSQAEGLTPAYIPNQSGTHLIANQWGNVELNLWNWDAGRNGYRLPMEAEWEYACRAGAKTQFCFGDDPSQLVDYGHYGDNSNGFEPVKTRLPNQWGIYDMHGSAWELCHDWVDYDWVAGHGEPPDCFRIHPRAPVFGRNAVARGGSMQNIAMHCTSDLRMACGPQLRFESIGFRVVRNVLPFHPLYRFPSQDPHYEERLRVIREHLHDSTPTGKVGLLPTRDN